MSFFRQPRPRRYHHTYMYVDERKERLQRLKAQAIGETDAPAGEEARGEKARGDLAAAIEQARQHRKARRTPFSFVVVWMAVLVLVIVVLCFCLMAAA